MGDLIQVDVVCSCDNAGVAGMTVRVTVSLDLAKTSRRS